MTYENLALLRPLLYKLRERRRQLGSKPGVEVCGRSFIFIPRAQQICPGQAALVTLIAYGSTARDIGCIRSQRKELS